MVAPPMAGRKVRTPQDKAPLKRRTPQMAGMESAAESKQLLPAMPERAMVKGWCKRPPVFMETWAAR